MSCVFLAIACRTGWNDIVAVVQTASRDRLNMFHFEFDICNSTVGAR